VEVCTADASSLFFSADPTTMSYAARPGAVPSATAIRQPSVEYICAGTLPGIMSWADTDCSALNEIRAREPIRCRECGHRIMYKKRTKRMVRGTGLLVALTCSFILWLGNL